MGGWWEGVDVRVVGEGAVDPAEAFGADTRGCLLVGLVAGFGEFEAEVGVFMLAEGDASEYEVAAAEAGD